MRTYRFTVTVSETGIILLPAEAALKGKEVEVVITPRAGKRKAKGRSRAFAEKWAGFLKPADDGDTLFGAWTDSRDSDEIIRDIREARTPNRDSGP